MMDRPQDAEAIQNASTSLRLSQSPGRRALWATHALVAAPVSSSSSQAEYELLPMFPQSSTVISGAPDVRPAKAQRTPHVLPVTAEQLRLLQGFFALSKTQLAQICGVQRQTIYDWLAGNFEAEGNNARRVAQLFVIAKALKAAGARALSARDLTRRLSDETTILSLLGADPVSPDAVLAVLVQLQEAGHITHANSASATRERLGWQPTSKERAERNLEANLDDFVDG